MARTPSSLQPPTPLQLWSQSAEHIRLLILEAMNAGVSPKSFGVSTSAPNTMRALIISMLSFCWGMEWGGVGIGNSSVTRGEKGPQPLHPTTHHLGGPFTRMGRDTETLLISTRSQSHIAKSTVGRPVP